MPRFFLPPDAVPGSEVTLEGEDARHIALSLRMAAGESITVCDGRGEEMACILTALTPQSVTARVVSRAPCLAEPPYRAVLYQALPKGDKMDTIVQKAVETGVYAVVPVLSARCVSRPEEKALEKKRERWAKIAREAAMQSQRGIIPAVRPPMTFGQAVEEMAAGFGLFCYEGSDVRPLGEVLPPACPMEIGFIIGPEGGFSDQEANLAREMGIHPVGLGKRILRSETASAVTLSCLSYQYELCPQQSHTPRGSLPEQK